MCLFAQERKPNLEQQLPKSIVIIQELSVFFTGQISELNEDLVEINTSASF